MNDTTIGEVLEFLQENVPTKEDLKTFANKEDLKVFATKEDLKVFATKEDLGKMKLDIGDMMDEKMADLKGDLVILMRKEDKKLLQLVEIMKRKALLTDAEVKEVLSMEPFPQIII